MSSAAFAPAGGRVRFTLGARSLALGIGLAAALVFASPSPARAGSVIIPCYGIDESGCEQLAYFDASLNTVQSYTWQFWDWVSISETEHLYEIVYSFSLTGNPSTSFFVDVTDPWTPPTSVPGGLPCISSVEGVCLVFTATGYAPAEGEGGPVPGDPTTPEWVDGYRVAILWQAGDVIEPPYYSTILKHDHEDPGDFTDATFLTDILYAPYLAPPDPGISGHGTGFSTFGAFIGTTEPPTVVYTKDQLLGLPVPEPASMILLGTGLAGLAFRARRRRR